MSYSINVALFKTNKDNPLRITKQKLLDFTNEFDLPESSPVDANRLKVVPGDDPLEEMIISKFWWSGMGSSEISASTFLMHCLGECEVYFVGEDGTMLGCHQKIGDQVVSSGIAMLPQARLGKALKLIRSLNDTVVSEDSPEIDEIIQLLTA